jgi:predicted dehydrogenase
MPVVRIAVAGFGHWGPNIARNLRLARGAELAAVCDLTPQRRANAEAQHPGTLVTDDFDALLADPSIDAIALATPAASHHRLASMVLEARKHVLVEKPLAMSVAECDDLIALADRVDRVLMVGHTFRYNSAVTWIEQALASDDLGDVLYAYTQRLNLGQIRQDVNVMWNLAPHDISILLHLLGSEPSNVVAHGQSFLQPGMEDVVFLNMAFASGALGHVHVSWLDPQKVRSLTLVGTKKMVVYDDTSVHSRIKVYDKGVEFVEPDGGTNFAGLGEFQLALRSGDLLIPHLEFEEPLRVECEEFVASIAEGRRPLTDGAEGRRIVRVLEAAQRSLEKDGTSVVLGDARARVTAAR